MYEWTRLVTNNKRVFWCAEWAPLTRRITDAALRVRTGIGAYGLAQHLGWLRINDLAVAFPAARHKPLMQLSVEIL